MFADTCYRTGLRDQLELALYHKSQHNELVFDLGIYFQMSLVAEIMAHGENVGQQTYI